MRCSCLHTPCNPSLLFLLCCWVQIRFLPRSMSCCSAVAEHSCGLHCCVVLAGHTAATPVQDSLHWTPTFSRLQESKHCRAQCSECSTRMAKYGARRQRGFESLCAARTSAAVCIKAALEVKQLGSTCTYITLSAVCKISSSRSTVSSSSPRRHGQSLRTSAVVFSIYHTL